MRMHPKDMPVIRFKTEFCYSVDVAVEDDSEPVYQWCDTQLVGDYFPSLFRWRDSAIEMKFHFNNARDATLFKLHWG